ncbi:hypothetical protein AB3X91_08935 [Paraburkholderia sp. BR14263]|uniref:hypothetical protein n=1 Tax=unclassified Paraburkholderia TaxID=2615204 RepID=UPI0034CE6B90
MTKKPYTMTVREFKERIADYLNAYPDDTEIYFGAGDLSLYRLKPRHWVDGEPYPRLVQIEFNQIYEVDIDPEQDN